MSQKISFLAQFYPFLNTSKKTVAYLMHHLVCHQWSKLQTKLTTLSYSRKNLNREVENILFWKLPWNFWICHFTVRNFRENKLLPLEILRNCLKPLRNFKVKNQDPWRLHDIFLCTPGNSTSFLIDPWNFQVLSSISLEIPCPQPLSPFSGVLAKNIPKSNLKWQFLMVPKQLTIWKFKTGELQFRYQ